jgi:RNA polymerase sigma-70 factor (ECF subfamily)
MSADATTLEPGIAPDAIAPLLARVADGQRDAFESLYRQTSHTLLGICLRVLRDRDEAEDVLQEVYVAVWSRAGQFDAGRARAMTWLGSIARNRAIDRVRARPSALQHMDVDALELADEDAPTAAAGIDAARERAQLDECIAQLVP